MFGVWCLVFGMAFVLNLTSHVYFIVTGDELQVTLVLGD